MKKIALIVAGGVGKRMNSSVPKQFLKIKNLPVLMHTINCFSDFEKIILVLPKNQVIYWSSLCNTHHFNQKIIVVEGGKNRFKSVKNGLTKINEASIVFIHDGVRPLVSKKLMHSLGSKVKKGIGVVPVIPVKSSIREVKHDNSKSVNRENLFVVQTPQCFLIDDIKTAYKQEFEKSFTDDASVFENAGGKILCVLGEEKNLKITTKDDLKIASFFMQ
tara:strand:+ start:8740 stop:9393 length:654 start_codon:yes stop_codon:yes gene_type:complete